MSILRETRLRRRPRWCEFGCASLDCLSDRTRHELARRGDQCTAWPGQILLAAGATVHWVFLVLDGELVLQGGGRDIQVLRAGSVYGGLEVLHHTRAPADLVARDVTRVLALPAAAYIALAETHPDFAMWVLRSLAQRQAA